MTDDPILREKRIAYGRHFSRFTVTGGLHYLKGNNAPYFSLTYWEIGRDEHGHKIESGGAGHETILEHYPELADLAALHLSDIDGVPMHAEANGWYNLAGYFPDAFGEPYHRGNSPLNFPCTPPADKPWANTEHRLPTSDECLDFFAKHCRIPLAEARNIAEDVQRVALAAHDDRRAIAKQHTAWFLQGMRPRWKIEAEACITKHGLIVYGDKWPQ